MKFIKYLSLFVAVLAFNFTLLKAENHTSHSNENELIEAVEQKAHKIEGEIKHLEEEFNPGEVIMHHIADANEFHIFGSLSLPLPVILYDKAEGLKFFLSSAFDHGHKAIDGYVIDHGVVKKIKGDFPKGEQHVEVHHGEVMFGEHHYETEGKHTLLQSSSFYDFSITKNVFTIILACILLLIIFIGMARYYKKGNQVPKGFYAVLEPIVLFIKEDIAIPNIGEKKYEKFLPYLLTVFFFIWIINIFGLIPFFPGSANVTGNIAITFALAIFTFFLVNLNGTKEYWLHILWPPVPWWLKFPFPLMQIVELAGVISKPFALMIRLFANISAGHILILSLLSLIFIFNNYMVAPVSIAFVLFMSILELLVAVLQAYIFTLLSALFIGLATEEHH